MANSWSCGGGACHVFASDQREANADAPPFEIAKQPHWSLRIVDSLVLHRSAQVSSGLISPLIPVRMLTFDTGTHW
jgi:hypothetical protein